MRRFATPLMVLGIVTAACASFVQPASAGSAASEKAASSASLDKLIQVHVQEAAAMRAELTSLHGNHAATFVWLVMIQDDENAVQKLSALLHESGSGPDTAALTASPAAGSVRELIQARLESHQAILKVVEDAAHGTTGGVHAALRQDEGALKDRLELLRSLQKGHPITGA